MQCDNLNNFDKQGNKELDLIDNIEADPYHSN